LDAAVKLLPIVPLERDRVRKAPAMRGEMRVRTQLIPLMVNKEKQKLKYRKVTKIFPL
jgi:hypothetical protein